MSFDLISIFHHSRCTSGFISHLYQHEVKHLFPEATVPNGVQYRMSPTSYLKLPFGDEPSTTLCQDFQTKLDSLLKIVLLSNPHYVLCIKPNNNKNGHLDSQFVARAPYMSYMSFMTYLTYMTYMAYGILHAYICQYGCQKKR